MARATRNPSGHARRSAAGGPPPAATHVAASRSERVLAIALMTLLALRVALAFTPGRAAWGFDLLRDLAPAWGWVPLALTVLVFIPSVRDALVRMGPRSAGALMVIGALALAAFLWTHPDRALVNGDTSLRHGAFATTDQPERFAEQALRGDLLLHHDLPLRLGGGTDRGAEAMNRAQGVLAALLSVLAASALARALGATGLARATVVMVSVSTGALALFNGYGKATVELAVLTLVIAAGLVRGARGGAHGLAWTGLAVAVALTLHRSALAFVPAWLVAVALAPGAWPRPIAARGLLVGGLLAPAVALASVLPRLVAIVGGFDTPKHLHGGLGAALAFAATPAQWADVANALGILFPLVLLMPVLLLLTPRPSGRETMAWAALVLPWCALLLLTHPQHGLPRDWDVYVPVGVALAAFTAARVSALFAHEPRTLRLAPAIVLLAIVPALQWVALQADAPRTWARLSAVQSGPPLRPADERAQAFDTIGMLAMGRGQLAQARESFLRASEAAPNPGTFVRIGMAETLLGRPAEAMAHYRHAATLDPQLPTAWRGIAAAASAVGDREAMAEAVQQLERLMPDDPVLPDARAWLAQADARRRAAAR